MDWQIILQDIEMAIPLILAILKQVNLPVPSGSVGPMGGQVANNPVHTLHVMRNDDGTVTVSTLFNE